MPLLICFLIDLAKEYSPSSLDALWLECDKDNDGKISFLDFQTRMCVQQPPKPAAAGKDSKTARSASNTAKGRPGSKEGKAAEVPQLDDNSLLEMFCNGIDPEVVKAKKVVEAKVRKERKKKL